MATRTASREEIRAHVELTVSPRTIGNCLLAAGLELLCASGHDTDKHGYFGVLKESTGEWNRALLSSVMRVGSVCMRVMDIHVYGEDLVSVIFRSSYAHDTQAPPQASWCGGHQLQLVVTFGVSAG